MLSNKPRREWVIAEAIRIADDFNVDWILQDGQDHTHHPPDSKYSNAWKGSMPW